MNSSKIRIVALVVLALSGALAFLDLAGTNTSRSTSGNDRAKPPSSGASGSVAQVRDAYGQLPLAFEQNRGQADEATNFRARGAGYTLSLSATEATFLLARGSDEPSLTVLRMNLVGANPGAAVEGLNELEGKVNYLIGNDPAQWRTNIPTFGRVRYSEVYRGIDVVYYGNQRRLEYDFVVAPGSDASAIALEFAGAQRLEVEAGTGDLLLAIGEKTVRQQKPIVYQEVNGARHAVESRYAIHNDGRVGFEVGNYDRSAPLVIDPVLVYSTYLGGNSEDSGLDIAVDSAGNAYVTGFTRSTDFPTANPLQAATGGDLDAFVTKLNPSGTAVVYSTYLGGSAADEGLSITIDSGGNAYVAGKTSSTNFPTANALQAVPGGAALDGFVTKLNSTGSALVYSTYLGGSDDDVGNGIAVDSAGNAYVTGYTFSTNFPIANAIQATYGGDVGKESFLFGDAFVTKINSAGSALVYSTYLGGSGSDAGYGIAVDATGAAYVAGDTGSTNFPTLNPLQATSAGIVDVFITKLNPAGSALVYSTYLGGAENDHTTRNGIALDSAGSAHVVGVTDSVNFPLANAFQGGVPGEDDAFVTKLNPAGSALVYSTFLGGFDGFDAATGIAVDAAGNAHITGHTSSDDFPTGGNAFQSTFGGATDAFVTKFTPAGGLIYSSYLGGSGSDSAFGVAVDSAGDTYLTGVTNAGSNTIDFSCFPITTGAFDTSLGGVDDAFVTKISETGTPAALHPCLSKLLNISARVRVLTGDSALIGGFIITGNAPKEVIIRGIGPSLMGVQGPLANPTLELFNSNQVLLDSNDDWITNRAEVEATTIPPTHDLESAIVITLAPGAYTAVLRGKNNGTGIGLVEIYDLNDTADSELANVSSRGFVGIGDDVMIGGFIVGGEGRANARVAVRALGPSLGARGITDPLQDPVLEVKDANGTTLINGDNWRQDQPGTIEALGLAPSDDREAAIFIALPHGNYTAILRGKNNTMGVAVLEVYNVP